MALGPSLPGLPALPTLPSIPGLTGSSSLASATDVLPWNQQGQTSAAQAGLVQVNSSFFPAISVDSSLWDKVAPYRLVVFDTAKNIIVGGSATSEVDVYPCGNMAFAFKPVSSAWIYVLPITPQQLNISDQFAINTSATLKGILEEHNGVRFKQISINGTFGVWQRRLNVNAPPSSSGPLGSALQSIFGGAIAAAQNVATQFTSIINTLTTGNPNSKPVTVRPGDPGDPDFGYSTGYYQAMMLQQFLEQYAEAKKDPKNSSWRLVLDIPKQNQSYVVTPVDFRWIQNVNKPVEINFSLQLKGWRRINLTNNVVNQPSNVTPLTPGILQRITNTISAAQNTAAASVNLIGSVRSDVDNVLNIITQTGLLVKDLAGVAIAVSDLPSQLQSDASSTISKFLSTFNKNNLFGDAASDSKTLQALSDIQASSQVNEGLSGTAVANGQLGPNAAAAAQLNPAANVFASPQQYPLLLGQVPVNSLTLNTAQQTSLNNAVEAARALTVNDLKNYRGVILDLCTQLESSFGAGSAFYSNLFGTNPPQNTNSQMNLDQYDILQSFYDLLDAYDTLTATTQLDTNNILSNMEYVESLAAASGIDFSIPNSKVLVPVPYGLTIEGIALRYTGSLDQWLEIATLNELREPYIDETGFQYPLLSNGIGRQITVGNNTNLYIGQVVSVVSATQGASARTILGIETLSTTSYLITLDGLANLNFFTTANKAYLQAYLPGTVNSKNNIFIPSNLPTPPDDMISIPSTVAATKLVGLSKVDLLLTPQNDLATTSDGDWIFAAGMANLIQALRIKVSTVRGTVYSDPTFGLSSKVGRNAGSIQAKDIYNEINQLIGQDSRFTGIKGLQVNMIAPTMSLGFGVGLAGLTGVFPVSFELPS